MNKNTILWVIAAIAVVVLAFLAYKMTSTTPAPITDPGTNATSTTPQVEAQEVSIGTGLEATPGSQVSVLYVGRLPDETIFDSSERNGNQPYTFVLGSSEAGSPIPGFQIGVNGMKEGGERVMSIPPELGYGAQEVRGADGKVVIPANTRIIFNVKLVKVTPPTAATTTPTR